MHSLPFWKFFIIFFYNFSLLSDNILFSFSTLYLWLFILSLNIFFTLCSYLGFTYSLFLHIGIILEAKLFVTSNFFFSSRNSSALTHKFYIIYSLYFYFNSSISYYNQSLKSININTKAFLLYIIYWIFSFLLATLKNHILHY